MTTTGARTSPSTMPASATLSTAAAPSSAMTLPTMRPSTYSPPEKLTSPRITTRGPISVSIAWPIFPPLPLSPNISASLVLRFRPVEHLVIATAVGGKLDPHALRSEPRRQHDAPLQLLEITEGERLPRRTGLLQQLLPLQARQLAGAHAVHREAHGALADRAPVEVLRERDRVMPRAGRFRREHRLVRIEAAALAGGTDEAFVEGDVGAQAGD